MKKAKIIRAAVVLFELLMGAALLVLHRFAYFRAGMNHHAKYRRMAFIRDFIADYRWGFWLLLILVCVWLLLRLRMPVWYRILGLVPAAGILVLLFVPAAKTMTIYYYVFLANAALLILHTAGAAAANYAAKQDPCRRHRRFI